MPSIRVVEKCSRCPREESFEVGIDEAVARAKAGTPADKALVIHVDGQELVAYDYLCEACRGIVLAYCSGTQKQAKKSARRFKRVVVEALPRASTSGKP